MSDTKKPLSIQVECYAGYRADERPQRFRIGQRKIEVADVIDQWQGPDYRYFKVRGSDDGLYILKHNENDRHWELTMYVDSRHQDYCIST